MTKPVSKYCIVYTVFTSVNAVLEYMLHGLWNKQIKKTKHILILFVNANFKLLVSLCKTSYIYILFMV